MGYQELLERGLPRAQVQYIKGATLEQDQYQMGTLGPVPAPNLIGFITRVQSDLFFRTPEAGPDNLLLMFWDGESFHLFVDPKIPVDALVGALELLKQLTVQKKLSQPTTSILGPTGRPIW